MDPVPETVKAIAELGAHEPEEGLLEQMVESGRRVREVVPDCVGLSLAMLEHGVTFTLVASDADIAVLDALQYLAGGPCVRAAEAETVVAMDESSMDEESWHLFARGTAAKGVASTLSMPIVVNSEVVGSVNLYGGSRRAFEGHHEQLAEILGAWAGGAITNADLTFSTRVAAREAPAVLRDANKVDLALGGLVAMLGVTMDEARRRLHVAATRAQLPPARVAEMITRLIQRPDV